MQGYIKFCVLIIPLRNIPDKKQLFTLLIMYLIFKYKETHPTCNLIYIFIWMKALTACFVQQNYLKKISNFYI
jgi:hypothetical protein